MVPGRGCYLKREVDRIADATAGVVAPQRRVPERWFAAGRGHGLSHRQRSGRQRARLVCADDARRAESLHGRQAPNNGPPAGHAAGSERQRCSDHRGQPFGYRRHGEGYTGHEGLG